MLQTKAYAGTYFIYQNCLQGFIHEFEDLNLFILFSVQQKPNILNEPMSSSLLEPRFKKLTKTAAIQDWIQSLSNQNEMTLRHECLQMDNRWTSIAFFSSKNPCCSISIKKPSPSLFKPVFLLLTSQFRLNQRQVVLLVPDESIFPMALAKKIIF